MNLAIIMELHNPFSYTFIATFLFLFTILKIVKMWSASKNLPPGPKRLPLIGNIHQIRSSNSMPHHYFKNLAEKYGPLMYLRLGQVPYIVVTSPDIAKEVMKTQDSNFCDRPNLLLPTIFSYNATNIAFAPYGEYWRQLRKICIVELLSAKRVQSFRSVREEVVSKLVKSISTSEGSIVNLTENINSMTYEMTSKVVFGKRTEHEEAYKTAVAQIVRLIGRFCIADLFPSVKILLQRVSREKTIVEKLCRETDRILQDIINDHKSNYKDEDLVDVLLNYQRVNHLTDDNIKAVIQDLFSAGSETSSGIVIWAMSEMVKNPKVMEEAQAEVRRVFDRKGYVDETGLHELIYLKSVIKETLRLHPVVPLLVPRESRERTQINGYEIPAKARVAVNVWAIGRDPKYWVEAENFKPERFVNSSLDFRGTDFEYLPFGAGRRMCPGIAYASPNIELPLATLLYHFDWKLQNGMKNEELDMTESFAFTLGRKNALCLIPITRRS